MLQPSLLSDRAVSQNIRGQVSMSQSSNLTHQGSAGYRGGLPRYQPPPQYSPGHVQAPRVSGGSESSVFTNGSGNSTPSVPSEVAT